MASMGLHRGAGGGGGRLPLKKSIGAAAAVHELPTAAGDTSMITGWLPPLLTINRCQRPSVDRRLWSTHKLPNGVVRNKRSLGPPPKKNRKPLLKAKSGLGLMVYEEMHGHVTHGRAGPGCLSQGVAPLSPSAPSPCTPCSVSTPVQSRSDNATRSDRTHPRLQYSREVLDDTRHPVLRVTRWGTALLAVLLNTPQ